MPTWLKSKTFWLLIAAIVVTCINLGVNQSVIPLKYVSYFTYAATAISAIVTLVQNQQLKLKLKNQQNK